MKHLQFKYRYEAAEIETNFIESINPVYPGKAFNHDPAVFKRYCKMQGDDMNDSGHRTLARRVYNHAGIVGIPEK